MDRTRRTSPDGDSRPTGSSDPYLGDLVRQQHELATEEVCSSGSHKSTWDGDERRDDGVGCDDPYVVEVTRPGRSGY
jgi:hypothetical protein